MQCICFSKNPKTWVLDWNPKTSLPMSCCEITKDASLEAFVQRCSEWEQAEISWYGKSNSLTGALPLIHKFHHWTPFKQFTWAKPKSWSKLFQLMHYTYPLKSSTLGWSHLAYIERQNSSRSWTQRGWGYSIWPSLVESADCSSSFKSAWHWPLGGDTHSLPQRPQTGEETLFGSGQRVSVCWHVSSRVRTHARTPIQTLADLNICERIHILVASCLSLSVSHVHVHTHMHTWNESGLKRSKR